MLLDNNREFGPAILVYNNNKIQLTNGEEIYNPCYCFSFFMRLRKSPGRRMAMVCTCEKPG
jgi:hypothetical protein